jgi:hypothetical protein
MATLENDIENCTQTARQFGKWDDELFRASYQKQLTDLAQRNGLQLAADTPLLGDIPNKIRAWVLVRVVLSFTMQLQVRVHTTVW